MIALLEFILDKLKDNNLIKKIGLILFIDIPAAINASETKCIASIRFANPECHTEFVNRYNGKLKINKNRIVINLSNNPPSFFAQHFIKNKVCWYNPAYPQKNNSPTSIDSTHQKIPQPANIEPVKTPTQMVTIKELEPKNKAVADRLEKNSQDLNHHLSTFQQI